MIGDRMTRRRVARGSGAGVLALTLLACEAPGAGPGSRAQAPVKLAVVTRGGGDGTGMEQLIIPSFTKTYPNIQVEHASLGGEPDYWIKVATGHLGKDLADVVWASTGGFHALGHRGVFKELDGLARADKYDFKDYVPGALETLKIDGKLQALPWGGHPGYPGLLYNEELLTRAGHKPPDATWTWDKLLEVARTSSRVTGDDKTDVYGFHPVTDYLGLTPIVRGNGADILDKEGKRIILGSPAGLQSLNVYRDLWARYRVAAPLGSNIGDLFVQGRMAMFQGNYGTQFAPGEKGIAGRFKWGMVILPKGSSGKVGTQLTINGMAMSALSKHPDAAWTFLKYIMEPEVQVPAVLSGASRPGLRKSVLRHPKLMSEMKSHAVWVDLMESAAPWHQPANFRWSELNEQINKAFAPAWKGEQTAEQALSQNLPAFDAILQKPREGFV
ncbi:MAG: sugar ABC transporter substrate-binding protein [Chloroflexota bacterium]|nr:sugar ABC transporter substrate-binding protein [Chloroflexota bacterium]